MFGKWSGGSDAKCWADEFGRRAALRGDLEH
jgi:hypothetical protein